jgi:hypothetical protein
MKQSVHHNRIIESSSNLTRIVVMVGESCVGARVKWGSSLSKVALSCLMFCLMLGCIKGDRLCKTIDDVDEETCKMEDLSVDALREVCGNLGLNVEEQVFPYLFDDESEGEDSDSKESKSIPSKERTHADYVQAALECLSIEEEMEDLMLDEDEDTLTSFLEEEMMGQDPGMLSEIMSELLMNDPNLLAQIEQQIKEEDPELYQQLIDELNEDKGGDLLSSLKDRPDLVAEVLTQMIMDDPSILEDFDVDTAEEGLGRGINAYFDLGEDEPDDEDAEDLEAIRTHLGDTSDEL